VRDPLMRHRLDRGRLFWPCKATIRLLEQAFASLGVVCREISPPMAIGRYRTGTDTDGDVAAGKARPASVGALTRTASHRSSATSCARTSPQLGIAIANSSPP
jgi:hypothetical protein